MRTHRLAATLLCAAAAILSLSAFDLDTILGRPGGPKGGFDEAIVENAEAQIAAGRQTFRFDTFGDEAFWGDLLRLHDAIQGEAFGGVGPGVSPALALAVGLKVDSDALTRSQLQAIASGRLDVNDPAVTLQLLRQNAAVGVTGFF